MRGSTGAFYFFHCFARALDLKPSLKIFYSIFEKKNFLSEFGHKHRNRLNKESSNQIDVLLHIEQNCNDQNKILTSLHFSWHESKVSNLILVKILDAIKCLLEMLQLNTSNDTFRFNFSIVQDILKNLKAQTRVWKVFDNWKPFKNNGKCFLFHFKNSFHSQDI